MKYAIKRKNYRDFNVMEIGRRSARAYFIPYSDKERLMSTPFAKERGGSDIVKVLSGSWDFKYYPSLRDMPAELDTDKVPFDKIRVPSTWQRTGYEPPVYLNCPYEIDTKAPALPRDMSAGVYRKRFTVSGGAAHVYIDFLGVIPCVDLYVNGSFVGYGEGAHNTSEFDITPFVRKGRNELVAVLHKWSTGTFLECQDMFRENGIFRDVLLYELGENYIEDYHVKPVKTDKGWTLEIQAVLAGNIGACSYDLELRREGAEVARASLDARGTTKAVLECPGALEWSAEEPNIYELYITLKKDGAPIETLRSYTGFKSVKIDGELFTFNGRKIKLKGVNHHDTHPKTGYVMSFADLERDVRLMKEFNVNAVRTSHYPPDPQFLTLCDLYGLYVVDEADIETHGAGDAPIYNINFISNSAKWIPRYVDRVGRMYYRDRNHPSITMWSLGNEAGGRKCQDACYELLHSVCPEIPVHYEGVIRTPRRSYDVVSEMYTSPEDMLLTAEHRRGKVYRGKPFYLCEYCHAMGVGPGSLEDYWRIIYSADNLMGGCIWEWADHAVWHDDGEYAYTYGGDHGERKHDGNFCVDALMYPDRTPHTGAYAMKNVYRPLRASYLGGGEFSLRNTNSFRSSGYLRTVWTLLKNGRKCARGSLALDIPAGASRSVRLDIPERFGKNEYHVTFEYFDGARSVAFEQTALNELVRGGKISDDGDVTLTAGKEFARVSFGECSAEFDPSTAQLTSLRRDGRELVNQAPAAGVRGFVPNLHRALLDNDVRRAGTWKRYGYDALEYRAQAFEAELEDGVAEIEADYTAVGKGVELFKVHVEYEFHGGGSVKIEAKLTPLAERMEYDLARFGLSIELDAALRSVRYFGLGERENLCDFKEQAKIGIYSDTVENMNEPYIKPQDNGNRTEVRFLELRDPDGAGVGICASEKPFSFSVHEYTQKLLEGARHREDLRDENTVALSIDGFMRGTGSGSCGPDTLKKYTFSAKDSLEFSFVLVPLAPRQS